MLILNHHQYQKLNFVLPLWELAKWQHQLRGELTNLSTSFFGGNQEFQAFLMVAVLMECLLFPF